MKIDFAQGMVQTLYADVPEDGTLPAAKALHQMGANNKRPNTFIEYYMWRNRLHFFMKYTPKDQLEQMSVNTLEMIFDAMLNGTNGKHDIWKQSVLSGDDWSEYSWKGGGL